MRWWLAGNGRAWTRSAIQAALAELCRIGVALEVQGADGQIRYRLAPGHWDDAKRLSRRRTAS